LTNRKKEILPGKIAIGEKQKTEEDLEWSIAQGRFREN
jgi:hypothetical protein